MPPEIWETAVELARRYGPCQIARGVGVDYKTLRLRLAKDVGSPKLVRPTFVQLPATVDQVAPVTTIAGATIEICIGRPSRAFPATPPCVRVRTRRFVWIELSPI